MGIWKRTGFSSYGLEDLTPESRENLSASHGLGADEPLLLNPDMLDELVCHPLDTEAPSPSDARYAGLRRTLLDDSSAYETVNGETAVALSEPDERFIREMIAAFREEDRAEMQALYLRLTDFALPLAPDELLASPPAAKACDLAAADVEAFLAKPHRMLRLGLDDLALSMDGTYVLIRLIELLRRLLIAAGRANGMLGDATVGLHSFQGVDDAVSLWRASDCPAARSLAESLSQLLSRTEGLSEYARAEIPPATPADASWIEACSQIGQEALRWALNKSGASLNFAPAVGTVWPGPALYGYDDEGARPPAARELCSALSRDGGSWPPTILYGTYEATISEGLAVPVPTELLKGSERLFVTESEAEPGTLFCQATSWHMSKVAKLIKAEQTLDGYPWDCEGDFEEEFLFYAFGDEIGVVDGSLPLEELSWAPGWAQPGADVVFIGVDDHFEIVGARRHAERLKEDDAEISSFLERRLE